MHRLYVIVALSWHDTISKMFGYGRFKWLLLLRCFYGAFSVLNNLISKKNKLYLISINNHMLFLNFQ